MCYKKRRIRNNILDTHRSGFDKEYIKVPCGTCPACRKVRSNDILVRAYFEFLGNERQGFFVTLDFDNDHLPTWYGKPCFDSEIMKKFLKRLRNHIGKFRYFYATDYGGLLHRPHYHFACFPEEIMTQAFFIKAIVATWLQGSHTNIQEIQSVNGDKLKAIEYIAGYATKDITWHQEDFNEVDKKMPPRFRPRCQPSNGFGLRALEEGIITSDQLLKSGTVALPVGKNGTLVKFQIPRYYEMKLCYNYHWDPIKRKAELIKNEFGVMVSKSRHNDYYSYFVENFRSSSGLDLHKYDFFNDSIFSGMKWFNVVQNCLSNFDDFSEFVYFRPFIKFHSHSHVIDTVRNECLIRPSWSYYEAAVRLYEHFMQEIDDVKYKVGVEKLIEGAKKRAWARVKRDKQLYNYLVKIGFNFNQLTI